MRLATMLLVVTLIACGPGPLPDTTPPLNPVDRRAYQEDWFPTTSEDPPPLNRAILDDKPNEVRALLEQGADPNARWVTSGDRFPLQDVLESCRFVYCIADPTEMIRLLLTHGADPNAKWCPFESRGNEPGSCRSAGGVTSLMAAAGAGLTEAVAMLLDAGADATQRAWGGESALDLASSEIAFELISRSLFPDLATRDQQALSWLRDDSVHQLNSDATLFSLAIERGSWYRPPPPPPPPWPFEESATAARLARTYPRWFEDRVVERFRALLSIGADPNQRSGDPRDHSTPLAESLRRNLLRAARVLLTAGADANQRECFISGFDQSGRKRIYEPACRRDNGVTALMSSAASGNREAVALLLEFKADRSFKDWAGRTALDYASTRGMKELLAAGR